MAKRLHGAFTIQSEDGKIKFQAYMGDGAAMVVEGYAGWEVSSRPRDIGIVEWRGRNPMAIEIPFLIDFYTSNIDDPGKHAETEATRLERLAGVGTRSQPPICRVDGGGAIPHDHTQWKIGRWVIEQIAWDRNIEIRRQDNGRRMRCGGTITIRQWVAPADILRHIKPNQKASKPKHHTVKAKESLSSIANKEYKDPNKWKLIADYNDIRDRRDLKVGSVLRIPKLTNNG